MGIGDWVGKKRLGLVFIFRCRRCRISDCFAMSLSTILYPCNFISYIILESDSMNDAHVSRFRLPWPLLTSTKPTKRGTSRTSPSPLIQQPNFKNMFDAASEADSTGNHICRRHSNRPFSDLHIRLSVPYMNIKTH